MMNQDAIGKLSDWVMSHHFGKYRGVVVENEDPEAMGRVKVKVPAVLGDEKVWAMPNTPYAGAGVGFYAIPEPGTHVWVEFEGGDPSFAIWSGCFWAAGELPEANDPAVKVWKTDKLTIRLDDTKGELRIESTLGAKITLMIEAKTEAGGATHTVGPLGVTSSKGAKKAELTDVAFDVNTGALTVL